MSITLSRRRLTVIGLIIAALVAGMLVAGTGRTSSAQAAGSTKIFFTCTGQKTGALTSGGTPVAVVNTSDKIEQALDPSTGLPTGKAEHKPFTFDLREDTLGRTNVRMTNAFITGENLTRCVFSYWRPDASGKLARWLTITFSDSVLTSRSVTESASGATMEWRLRYTQVAWEDNTTNTTTSASWSGGGQ